MFQTPVLAGRPLFTALVLAPVLTLAGITGACKSGLLQYKLYSNVEGEKPAAELAVLKNRGFLFWLDPSFKTEDVPAVKKKTPPSKNGAEEKNTEAGDDQKKIRYDELRLKPGFYVIRFVRTKPREGGVAACKLEAGKVYSFKIVAKQYLPKVGHVGFIGNCFFDPERSENRESGATTLKTEDNKTDPDTKKK